MRTFSILKLKNSLENWMQKKKEEEEEVVVFVAKTRFN